jgi:NTE family protein
MPEETLLYFYRGDHFGETSILTDQPHSASVEAKSDGMILKLDREDFLKFVNSMPSISLHLSRSLGHRLTQTEETQGQREVKTAALYAATESREALWLWLDMAKALFQETERKVLLIDFFSRPDSAAREFFQAELPSPFDLGSQEPSSHAELNASLATHSAGFQYLRVKLERESESCERNIKALITYLTYRFNYLLLRLPGEISHAPFAVLNKSDMVYVFSEAEGDSLQDVSRAMDEFQRNFGFSKSELRVIKKEFCGVSGSGPRTDFREPSIRAFCVLPLRDLKPQRYAATVRYLARELAGKLLGLVLGSGAAHGLAHIGVLKVLEEEGIHIDVISGSSIGALIGALWAAGHDAKTIEKLAQSLNSQTAFFHLVGLSDLSWPLRGFLKGNQIARFLSPYLGRRNFQDLDKPLKITATDVFTSEEVIFENGPVLDAVRASIAIPGIFQAVHLQRRHLIDGGIIDPLPVRVLTRMGVKKIIAVNVLQGPTQLREVNRMRVERARKWLEEASKADWVRRSIQYGMHKLSKRYAVNIFNAIMNSIQYMEYEMAQSWGGQADVLIHPVLPGAHWAEFYSPEKFIQMGEMQTRERVDDIQRLVEE